MRRVCVGIDLIVITYDHFLLMSGISQETVDSYAMLRSLVFNCIGGMMRGFLGGIALPEFNKRLRTRPYYKSALAPPGFFLLIASGITLITAIFVLASSQKTPLEIQEPGAIS
ncbi:MAG: hypothetical protein AAFR87_25075 [Bacteroidota bacterium]